MPEQNLDLSTTSPASKRPLFSQLVGKVARSRPMVALASQPFTISGYAVLNLAIGLSGLASFTTATFAAGLSVAACLTYAKRAEYKGFGADHVHQNVQKGVGHKAYAFGSILSYGMTMPIVGAMVATDVIGAVPMSAYHFIQAAMALPLIASAAGCDADMKLGKAKISALKNRYQASRQAKKAAALEKKYQLDAASAQDRDVQTSESLLRTVKHLEQQLAEKDALLEKSKLSEAKTNQRKPHQALKNRLG